MPIRANISPGFVWRLALVAAFCFGMALWFLFDGLVTYPHQRERALEYQRFAEEKRLDDWEEFAQQRGWSTEDPGEPKTEADSQEQFIWVGIMIPPGLIFVFRFLRARKRWVEATETGLVASWGQQLAYEQIVALNKKQWAKKGIAKVVYEDRGRKLQFVLDDWKFEADPTVAILREVESRIDLELIIHGLPEPPPGDSEDTEVPESPEESEEPAGEQTTDGREDRLGPAGA